MQIPSEIQRVGNKILSGYYNIKSYGRNLFLTQKYIVTRSLTFSLSYYSHRVCLKLLWPPAVKRIPNNFFFFFWYSPKQQLWPFHVTNFYRLYSTAKEFGIVVYYVKVDGENDARISDSYFPPSLSITFRSDGQNGDYALLFPPMFWVHTVVWWGGVHGRLVDALGGNSTSQGSVPGRGNNCAESSVPVSPACLQQALISLHNLEIPCPTFPREKGLTAGGSKTHK